MTVVGTPQCANQRRAHMRMPTWFVLAIATTGLAAGCAAGSAQQSQSAPEPVTIVTKIDFTADPYQGSFEVADGADALGCSTGTFVDTPTASGIHKEFTCESGARTGNFTAEFPLRAAPGRSWTGPAISAVCPDTAP